jgi:signal transduction histidine kinase/CheY-like chemotaxis protein
MTSQQDPAARRHRLLLRGWVPYVIFAVACALSVAASWYVSSTAEARVKAEFLTDAEEIQHQIEVRLNTYFEVVRAGAALLAASNEINGVEFRAFVAGLQMRERYPGMEGIGFSQYIRRQDLQRFVRAIDLDSGKRLRIRPRGSRPEYHPILFLEPGDTANQAAIGFDLSIEPMVWEAMARARDTGAATASGTLTPVLPFDQVGRQTFALLVPVYRTGTPVKTVEDRRRELIGFVFSPVGANDLLKQIVPDSADPLTFEVYDGPVATSAKLLSEPASVTDQVRYQSAVSLPVGGRDWRVVVRSVGPPVTGIPQAARRTLFVGLLLSFTLLAISTVQLRAWATSARHEAELRKSEQALRESESQAQAADRAKDEFLATLSHELRTPLNAILGWVSMLRTGSVREERRAHALEIIERNARLQADLIDDLLDVSRIVLGKVRLQLRPQAIAPIVSGVLESLRPSAVAKGLTLHVVNATEAVMIRADSGRVQQIVWNLVSNAIKFTPAGGHVYVELTRDDHYVHLFVRDTGIGIVPEFLPHVFERFRQADSSTTRPHSGVGLGLAIVHHLVQLHGGSIEARSEGRDRGALFVVHFPLTPASTRVAPVAVVTKERVPSAALDAVRVLVVDDDPNTREILTEALNTLGAQVTSADCASDALGLLSANGADVIVSDIAMPGEDGFSLIRRIRALPGDLGRIPAIALSAFARAEDRARALDAGYQMHLAKPVELAELQAELAKLAALHHST